MMEAKNKPLTIDSANEVHPAKVHELRQGKAPLLLLDVRHEVEWELGRIDGAVLIPLDTLVERLHHIANWRRQRMVVYCRSGVRSLRAAAMLREAGFTEAHSMAGGILAWAELVDPAIRWW